MDKNEHLEQVIKIALKRKAEEVQIPKDLFFKINSGLEDTSKAIKLKSSGYLFAWRVATLACSVLIIWAVFFVFSKEVGVLAAEVVNSVKKIFVVEKAGNSYQITEKSVNEYKQFQGICKITNLNDHALSIKVGYKVYFPESLDGEYQLDFKVLGVRIDKKLDIDTFQKLNDRILLAIDDNEELSYLEIYKAKRYTGAFYRVKGNTVGIYILEKSQYSSKWLAKKVFFDNHHGLWYEYPKPSYYENNSTLNNIQIRHGLYWELNGLGYHLRPEGESDITLDEAIQIAGSFLKEQ